LIYGNIATLPSNGRLDGLFSAVTITQPASVIADWSDGNSFVALPNGQWKDRNGASYLGSVHLFETSPTLMLSFPLKTGLYTNPWIARITSIMDHDMNSA